MMTGHCPKVVLCWVLHGLHVVLSGAYEDKLYCPIGATELRRQINSEGKHEILCVSDFLDKPNTLLDARKICWMSRGYLLTMYPEDGLEDTQLIRSYIERVAPKDPFIWLELKRRNGFYHWYGPKPRLVRFVNIGSNSSLEYGSQWASDEPVHDCGALNHKTGFRHTFPCNRRLPYICLHRNVFPSPTAADRQEIITVYTKAEKTSPYSSEEMRTLKLDCDVEINFKQLFESPYSNSVQYFWQKDGHYLEYNTKTITVGSLQDDTMFHDTVEGRQGMYRCGVYITGDTKFVWSDDWLPIYLRDVQTYVVSIDSPSVKIGNNPFDFSVQGFSSFLSLLELPIIASNCTEQNGFRWTFNRYSKGKFKIHMHVNQSLQQDGKEAVHECATALSEDININGSVEQLLSVSRCPLQVEEVFLGLGPINFIWGESDLNMKASSLPLCLNENSEIQFRDCKINFNDGASWKPFDYAVRCKTTQEDLPLWQQQDSRFICQERFSMINGKCVQFFSEALSKDEAFKTCRSQLSDLETYSIGLLDRNSTENFTGKVWVADEVRKLPIKNGSLNSVQGFLRRLNENWTRQCYAGGLISDNGGREQNCSLLLPFRCVHQPVYTFTENFCAKGIWSPLEKDKCFWIEQVNATFDEAFKSCPFQGRPAELTSPFSYKVLLQYLQEYTRNYGLPDDAKFWVGMRRHMDGTFTWINERHLTYINWDPTFNPNAYSLTAVSVQLVTVNGKVTLRWQPTLETEKLPVLCESFSGSFQGYALAEVHLESESYSSLKEDSSMSLSLLCNTYSLLPGSILWFKDGSPVVDVPVETVRDSSIVLSWNSLEDRSHLQGYYHCEGTSAIDQSQVSSDPYLLRFSNIATFLLHIRLTGGAANGSNTFDSATLETTTENLLSNIVEKTSILDVRALTTTFVSNQQVRTYHIFMYSEGQNDNINQEAENEMELYKKLTTFMQTVSESMVLEREDFHVTTEIKSTAGCFPDSEDWDYTPVNEVTATRRTCITGSQEVVYRWCLGNFTSGAEWGPVQGICSLHISPRTSLLQNMYLNQRKNLSDVLRELGKMDFSETGTLTPAEFFYVAKILTSATENQPNFQDLNRTIFLIDNLLLLEIEGVYRSPYDELLAKLLELFEKSILRLSRNFAYLPETLNAVLVFSVTLDAPAILISFQQRSATVVSKEEGLHRKSDCTIDIEGTLTKRLNVSVLYYKTSAVHFPNERLLPGSEAVVSVYDTSYETAVIPMDVTLYFKLAEEDKNDLYSCLSYDRRLHEWTDRDCRVLGVKDGHVVCFCQYLSAHAVIKVSAGLSRTAVVAGSSYMLYIIIVGILTTLLVILAVTLSRAERRPHRDNTTARDKAEKTRQPQQRSEEVSISVFRFASREQHSV